ncbi:Linear gramicidin synthase subunit D [Alteripontixanthobacter maritimus]|uniref:3-methylmercaptopropionyl-CoA ligase n=1 Tax=Alteripontixanthobacter maritimus TaxID=2161824 RepID=A0A369QG05_9SPHN|nr:long-chain-fatty-acid--CoA ligase [Alteripontixanthobacter maritimus]RDC61228.1 Linear gramicidin synthase subunit D [Alteripontixanthobacter maritimus]
MTATTYGEALARHAAERPAQIAVRFQDRTCDYAELDRRANRIARAFVAAGCEPGARIAYVGKNSDRTVELIAGAARANVVLVPIIWRLAPAEIMTIIRDCEAAMLFVEDAFINVADGFDGPVVQMETGFDDWRDAQADTPLGIAVSPDDVLLQLYTSGTTGTPKGVMLTHANGTATRKRLKKEGIYWYAPDAGDTGILAMPYGHIAGIGMALNGLLSGMEVIVHAEFDPLLTMTDIARHQVKWIFLVPAALRIMLAHPEADRADFSSVRGLTYGASPIPLDLLKEGVERLKCGFAQLYGLTETFGTVVTLSPEDHLPGREHTLRSAGQALPGMELRILGEDLEALGANETGEIAIRGPAIMAGYWKREEETARVMLDGGWFRTGDAGYLDEDGYLFIQDRIKDMIVSGGENVYPAEVESALYGHPAIADVAVIGVPDDAWGEAVKAVVVRKPGTDLQAGDVIAYARERIAGFKCPKSVDFIAELPRNPSGKILRRTLREPYWAGRDRQVN